jgi:hypothetical protein
MVTRPPGLGFAILPKDFAMAFGYVGPPTNDYALHLFYIRHSLYNIPGDDNEKNIGHTRTSDFRTWKDSPNNPPDTMAVHVEAGTYEDLHVWAPSIVHPEGLNYFMFYTAVQLEGTLQNQRIAFRISADLDDWSSKDRDTVLSVSQVPWAARFRRATHRASSSGIRL